MTNARNGRELFCRITDADGKTVDTDIASINVKEIEDKLAIITQPTDWSGELGATTNVTVVAQGKDLTYQWYYRTAGTSRWIKASDTDNCYDIQMTNSRNGRELICRITDADGNTIDTDVVTMSIG